MKKKSDAINGESKVINLDFITGDRYNAEEEKEKNLIGLRIEAARERLGLSRADLRYLIGTYGVNLHRDIIRRWEIGETFPSGYQLIALSCALNLDDGISYFGGLNKELNDEGQRKVAGYRRDLIATGFYTPAPTVIEYIDMPVSYLPASAGTGAFLDEGNFEMVSVPKSSVPKGAKFGVRVSGDSMEPVYNDGQLIWVQPVKELHPGEEGIFTLDGKGYVKSYSIKEPDESVREAFTDMYGVVKPQPVLISYNKRYDPIVVTPDQRFEIIGRVLH